MTLSDGGLAAICALCAVLWMSVFFAFRFSIRVVHHAEVMILERFGRYKKTLLPGLHFIVPIIERVRPIAWRRLSPNVVQGLAPVLSTNTERIDLREHVIDFGKQHVITKDTVMIDINALVYFRIVDPRLAAFKVQNIPDAVELVTQATLRNIVASMTLDDTFSSRDIINSELLSRVKPDVERWGVTITRVEIFDIIPPDDIKRAMEQQIKAERTRRSAVLEADGERESRIVNSRGNAAQVVLTAEGDRAAALLEAKGVAESKMLISKAEAQSMEAVRAAIQEDGVRAVDYLTAIQYLNVLRKITETTNESRLVLVPMDTLNGVKELMHMNR